MKIIYSNRKTISLSVSNELLVIVRAPKNASKKYINDFVLKHEDWIKNQIEIKKKINANRVILSDLQIEQVKKDAKILLTSRVLHFEEIMGVKSTGVKITSAKRQWGSCSGKNSLCFSYKTSLLPIELVDYVVVHELAHIIEKNHSAKFYAVVEKYLPDYKMRIAKIQEIGRFL